jgi:hypothetical protein
MLRRQQRSTWMRTMAEKVAEGRVRRWARRLGLRLERSRAHKLRVDDRGLYRLLGPKGTILAGRAYDLTLEQIEAHLRERERLLMPAAKGEA